MSSAAAGTLGGAGQKRGSGMYALLFLAAVAVIVLVMFGVDKFRDD